MIIFDGTPSSGRTSVPTGSTRAGEMSASDHTQGANRAWPPCHFDVTTLPEIPYITKIPNGSLAP